MIFSTSITVFMVLCLMAFLFLGMVINSTRSQNSALSKEQFAQIEQAVSEPLQYVPIARKLFGSDIVGPMGVGKQTYTWDQITAMADAGQSMKLPQIFDSVNKLRYNNNVPFLYKNFRIEFDDLASSKMTGEALDVTEAREAGAKIAKQEDQLLLIGSGGINGFYDGAGNGPEATGADFGTAGNAIIKTRLCLALLRADDVPGPFNMVLHPTQYDELMTSVFTGGIKEADVVKQALGGEIFKSSLLTAGSGLIQNVGGMGYFNIALSADITMMEYTHALFTEFYVFERLLPILKQTVTICSFTGA